MSDLFDAAPSTGHVPLAAALRPETLDDVIGQPDITREGSILRRRIAAGALGSLILYGPPGIGKTTIARAVGTMLGKEFRPLHATRDGVKKLREIADEARIRPLLIFVDEVHRFSATQAHDLLSICEEGTADFVGATTGNPYHALPPALVSRSTILKLEPMSLADMEQVVRRGLDHLRAGGLDIEIDAEQVKLIAGRSGGDARRALTTLESLTLGHPGGRVEITEEMLEEAYSSAAVREAMDADAAEAVNTLRRSITELCVADHQNDPAEIEGWLSNKALETWRQWIARDDSVVLVAERDREIVGVGMATLGGDILLNYVHPDARLGGVSKAILSGLEEVLRARGTRRCQLESTVTAKSFYESCGFRSGGGDPLLLSKSF